MKKAKSNPESQPLRVLILEDNPADAELIERQLRRAKLPFTARLVEGKREFVRALADFQPQVILSDFKLPRFDGLAALAIARRQAPDIPFIFVSGSIGEEKAVELLSQGASDYIFKDNLTRLGPAVERVIEESRLRREKKRTDKELQDRIKELRILSEASDQFVHFNELDKVYDYLAETIRRISGADFLLLTLYDEKRQALRPKIIIGFEPFLETCPRRFRIEPMQMIFYLKDMRPNDFRDFISRRLLPVHDGLHGLANRQLPRAVCRACEKLLAIESLFTMGFSWENQLYGGLTIFFRKGNELQNALQVESVVNLATVAIKRLLAERSLRESEEKYRTLVTQSPDGIFVVDLQGNFLSVNQAMCAGLKYSEAEFLSLKIQDVVPEQFMGLHKKRLAAIMNGEAQNEAAEYLVREKDGQTHYVAILSTPFYKHGQLIGFQGIARDTTEKKKMETRLRESEEYYRTLVQTSPDAIILVDAGGRITFASKKAIEVFALPAPTSLAGISILDFVDPAEIPRVQERLVEILSGRSLPEVREYRLLRHDRRPFWGEISSAPLHDAQGRNIGLMLICRDVSERKRSEAALRESEEKYRLIADNTAETITVLDLDLNYTYVSPSIFRLRGFTVEEAMAQTLKDTLTSDSLAMIREVLSEEMAREMSGTADPQRSRLLELQEFRKDGSIIWVENSLSFLHDPGGKPVGFLAVSKDISERKRAEHEQKKLLDIIENSLNEIYLFNASTLKFEYVNQGALRNIGYSLSEMMEMTPVAIKPKFSEAEFKELLEPLLGGHRSKLVLSTIHRRKDGSEYPVEIHLQLFRQENQSVFFAVINDISERQRAQEQIQYQAGLLQSVSDAIIATDQNSSIRVWNKAAERIYGWKAAEVIGRMLHDVLNPEYRYQDREEVLGRLEKEGAWSGEIVHHHRDGRALSLQSSIQVLKNTAGDGLGMVSVNHDISERKQAEIALRRSENLLSKIFDILPVGIWIADRNGKLVRSNHVGRQIWGGEPLVGQEEYGVFTARRLPGGEEITPDDWALAHTIREKTTTTDEMLEIDAFDGTTKTILNYTAPVLDESGDVEAAVIVNLDISARQRAEELIRSSLKEKEILLQEIHHRVKNNLQIISGLLTLEADQAAGRPVDEIFRESQDRIRSIALVHEKLYRSHNLAEIAFDDYLRNLVENLFISHGVAAGRIIPKFAMEPILFSIEKAIPLGLIVNELVTNVLKHAFPAGQQGEIRIALHQCRGVNPEDTGTARRAPADGRNVPAHELIVADDGVGVPAGFDPDTRKSLGMHLVSMLSRQLHAELKVKSGPGAEFRLIFSGSPGQMDHNDNRAQGGTRS